MKQHNQAYATIHDAVDHAGMLWQTLNPDKVRQEIKGDLTRRRRPSGGKSGQSGQSGQPGRSGQSDRQKPKRKKLAGLSG